MSKKTARIFDCIFPLVIGLLVFISIVIWLKLDSNLPHWDMGRHLYHTIKYRELWQGFFDGEKSLAGLLTMYMYYPPLVHNLGLIFSIIFGFSADSAVYSNIVWIMILSYSIYCIAKHYFDRIAAVGAVIIIFSMPIIIGQMREFQVDFPLLSIFALSFWMLIKSDNFKNSRFSFLFGLVFGLGMMVKWSYAFFGLPLAGVYAILALWHSKEEKRAVLKNILFAAIGALLVCGLWYYRNLSGLRSDFGQNGVRQAQVEGDPYGLNIAAYSWYAKMSSYYYFFLPLLLTFILGLLNVFKKKETLKRSGFLVLLLALFYLIISTLPNKDIRYIMPAILLAAVIAASAINLSRSKYYQIVSLLLLSLVFLANNMIIAFGKYLPVRNESIALSSENYVYSSVIDPGGGYTSNSPKEAVCPMNEIIEFIPEGASAREIGRSQIDFSDWAVAYNLMANSRAWQGQVDSPLLADYLISRSSNLEDPYLTDPDFASKLEVVKTFNCADGSNVSILKVK